eukprot:jgi/Mesen1/6189/ME000032S05485
MQGDGEEEWALESAGRASPSSGSSTPRMMAQGIDSGEKRLNELGYKQELKRDLTTGSLYYWAASLAGPKYGPFAAWMTVRALSTTPQHTSGWLEFIGLAVGVGSQAFAGVEFLGLMVATIVTVAVLNSFAVRVVALLDVVSIIGGVAMVVTLPLVAPRTQPASYYSLYGFDSAAHMTEETRAADRTGPVAILSSVAFFSIFGWGLLLSLTFSIQDPSRLFAADTATGGGYPVAQILWDAFHGRCPAGDFLLVSPCFYIYMHAPSPSFTPQAYALARDNGLPFSPCWRRLSAGRVPVGAVWLCAGIGVAAVLPELKSDVVFFAVTSMSTVGWVGGYAVPIFFRMYNRESSFVPGPFYLGSYVGRASKCIHLVAFCWILYTVVVFLLPQKYPITYNSFNYAPVGMAVVCSFFLLWWLLDARKWFKGPVKNIVLAFEDDPSKSLEVEGVNILHNDLED